MLFKWSSVSSADCSAKLYEDKLSFSERTSKLISGSSSSSSFSSSATFSFSLFILFVVRGREIAASTTLILLEVGFSLGRDWLFLELKQFWQTLNWLWLYSIQLLQQ